MNTKPDETGYGQIGLLVLHGRIDQAMGARLDNKHLRDAREIALRMGSIDRVLEIQHHMGWNNE